ncbi:hypothetical protein [Acinetobacter sp. AR2-3]|jgi:hypothetical protein|uniref:hypothetical protein n=1 Tax=Acinetobacter sp. AR2-3 TaxID=1891969 RepID=UPI0008FFF419|nr:hypothetical protein [Acinetobacter sp. AR2-3]OIU79314.1 hypothetical protein BFN00_13925 [Acinetobacter sp. AR2-3]
MNMKCLSLLSSLFLVACATGGNQYLHQSLQPYMGQTAAQVRSQLDLRAMGFKTSQKPIQTAESLSYTIFREMNISMGTPNISQSISIGAPMPMPSNGGYNIEMKCQIWFDLKDEIVQAIRYTGKAC